MKIIRLYILLGFALFGVSLGAQPRYHHDKNPHLKRYAAWVEHYADSLSAFQARIDSLGVDSVCRPLEDNRMAQLFGPLTFYHHIAADALRLKRESRFSDDLLGAAIDSVLLHVYLTRPDLVRNNESRLQSYGAPTKEVEAPVRHKVDLVDKVAPTPLEPNVSQVSVLVRRPNFWRVSGDYYLQLMQNCVSGNWYRGGESNYSMVGNVTLQANYNTKQGVKWDNKLEMKLGFQNSRSDSLHTIKTSEDLLRYTGKLGLQATKHWYYTIQWIVNTQFAKGYRSNDPRVYSAFLSPLVSNLSIGMDYNVNWLKGRLRGNVHLAPLAYNFKFVERKALATRYGLDEGKHTLNDYGSELTVDLTWQLLDNLKWKTRLYGYTTYERSELEWENTFTFTFNRYITSNLFIYPRFDDGTRRDAHHGYWQFKEYLSMGFSYSF